MSWDFSTDREFQEQLDWMRELTVSELYPLDAIAEDLEISELDALMGPLQQRVKERGLWAAHLDPEHGGQGFGQVKLGLMQEIIGSTFTGMQVFGCQAPDSGNSEILALRGTDEQKKRYLAPLLAGTARSCFAMTEPHTPGSDPTRLATRAVRDPSTGSGQAAEWVLDGQKWFASNASIADFFVVVAVTDPEAPPHQRATMFLVDKGTPGLEVVRDVPTMHGPAPAFGRLGNHAEIRIDGLRVAGDAVLGGVGEAFPIAQLRLGPGRIHHCMRWLGQAQRALDMMCEWSTHRFVHGSLLAEKQTVQNWIADSSAEIQAARLMTLHAAWKIDTQGVQAARTDIAMIKYFGAKVLHDVIDRAIQAHGSLGYSGDLPLESMYRHARAARIYDGPDEVHRQTVARHVLKGYAPPPDGIPTNSVPRLREQAAAMFAQV